MQKFSFYTLERKKRFLIFGGCILAFGAIMIALGVFFSYFIHDQVRSGIENGLVMKSKDQDGYDKWKTNDYSDAVPVYQSYRLWNMTNIDEVLKGGKPSYEEGPLCTYRKFFEKTNVTFSEDQTEVSFGKRSWFKFEPSLSPDCDSSKIIYNINPAYVGLLLQAGGDENFSLLMIGPTLSGIFSNLLSTTLPTFVIFQTTGQFVTNLRSQIQSSMNSTTPDLDFFAIWANATSLDDLSPQWKKMGVISLGSQSASGITASSCQALFDPTNQFSFLNPKSFALWTAAAAKQSQSQLILQSQFNLSEAQLSLILQWKQVFVSENQIIPYLVNQFGIGQISDLGWLQWGQGKVLGGQSAFNIFGSSVLAGVPEFYFLADTNHGYSTGQCRRV
eukprot:TRINITY_DN9376_c0_g1_i1.p1 TRINITY_DN9376_c0_g1~~TRINITY_DN9376_c0_g1_i1.p1  ORF type:complete len:389 (+),score=95.54 TRINITY_DN9376_c0_g1_i1:101-1267(+)